MPTVPDDWTDEELDRLAAQVGGKGVLGVLIDMRRDVDQLKGQTAALVVQRPDGSFVARAARFDWKAFATAFGLCVTPIVVAWLSMQ